MSTSAADGEHAAATVIASELGDVIAKVAVDTFTAGHAIGAARMTTQSGSIRIPTTPEAAWKQRLHHIDQAHARIAAVHGADPVRTAALQMLETLRSSCRAGELALTSSTASERSRCAKRQQADQGRLHSVGAFATFATLTSLCLAAPAMALTPSTSRVSLSSSGGELHSANGTNFDPDLSADGRYLVFATRGTDLVADDTNAASDVFVRDRRTGETRRLSVKPDGGQTIDGESFSPSISADGRYVSFKSYSNSLVAGDSNGMPDVFVRDRVAGTTTLVSHDLDGTQIGPSGSEIERPAISADGNWVVWGTNATSSVAGAFTKEFVSDRVTGAVERADVTSAEVGGAVDALRPAISGDGRFVAFDTAGVLDNSPTDDNNQWDIFVRDRQAGTTARVSLTSAGQQTNNAGGSFRPALSDDGRYVAFESDANNLVFMDTNSRRDIFVKDRQTGAVERANVSSAGGQATLGAQTGFNTFGAALDATGRHVAFEDTADSLVGGELAGGYKDVFVHDRETGLTTRASVDSSGAQSASDSILPALNASGRFTIFQTNGILGGGDMNNDADAYFHDSGDDQPPVSAFTATPSPLGVTVDASNAADPDGWVTGYAFTFGDGGSANGAKGPHNYAAPGQFTITLTVTDNDGATATTSQTVAISAAAATPPPPGGSPPARTPLSGPDRVTISPATVRLARDGTAALKVACPATAPIACSGRLTLKASVPISAKSRREHTVTLGSHTFSVRAGRTVTVKVALSVANRRLVAKAKRLKATALASFRDAARVAQSSTRGVTLQPPLSRKAKRSSHKRRRR